jgi:hypothetical protein
MSREQSSAREDSTSNEKIMHDTIVRTIPKRVINRVNRTASDGRGLPSIRSHVKTHPMRGGHDESQLDVFAVMHVLAVAAVGRSLPE